MEPRKRKKSKGSTFSEYGEDQGATTEQVVRVETTAERSSEAVASLPGSKSTARFHMLPAREPGDLEDASPPVVGGRPAREGRRPYAAGAQAPKPHPFEESDAGMVPEKS